MKQDRWGVTIRGQHIPHNVAARDWFCECGNKVVTRYYEDAPHWRSVCSADDTHDPDKFIHTKVIPYVQYQMMVEALTAQEVFDHLPKELQKAITERRETDAD